VKALESLMKHLSDIPEPRDGRGVRHSVMSILTLVMLGFICGYTNIEHIVAFGKSHWDELQDTLGFRKYYCPNPTTVNRLLRKIDREALEKAFEAWVSELVQAEEFTACVDGKASRGVVGSSEMMVNVFAQEIRLTLAQWPLQEKAGEPTVLRQQLAGLFARYPGLRILTGDALYAGRDMCQAIVDLGRDYLVRIKGNQGAVEEALSETFRVETQKRKPDVISPSEKKGGPLLPARCG
jgi:hypothetical protein